MKIKVEWAAIPSVGPLKAAVEKKAILMTRTSLILTIFSEYELRDFNHTNPVFPKSLFSDIA